MFAGEYGTTDTDQLWLHGKLGIYMTTNGYANNVVAYYNPASNTNFVFNTNLRVNGVNITSDARLKENVESLQNPLALLEQVNGVSYSYNLSTLEENREQDESKFSATLDNGISGSSSDSSFINFGVYPFLLPATSSGVPAASTCPPPLPPSGPISMM